MTKQPQHKQQMENILQKLTVTISEFDGFMKIEFSHRNEIPEVTEAMESTANFEEVVRKKLRKGV